VAQRVKVMLVCDLHEQETEGSETIEFAVAGTGYEIDLCEEHARGFREAIAPYVGVARRSGGRSARPARAARRPAGGPDRQRTAEIREWARGQGLDVSERGRIPASLVERYEAAH
jgi:hypothetical protein